MKIRNGFVSNSSSSSFILAYDKTKVTHNPEDVVSFVKEHPYDNILIHGQGYGYGEGEDIFELDEDQKSLIRKFSKEFIEVNSGDINIDKYEYDDEAQKGSFVKKKLPKITAYLGGDAYLQYDDMEYENFEDKVDMSDIGEEPFRNLPLNEFLALSEEDKAKSNAWYHERAKRAEKLRKESRDKELEEVKNKSNNENVEAEYIDVSRASCDGEIYDFKERYLTKEWSDDYDFLKRYNKYADEKPYVVLYDEILENKEEILEILNEYDEDNLWRHRNAYLIRYNDVLEPEDTLNLDLYSVNSLVLKELKNKKNAKKFLGSNIKVKLILGGEVYESGETLSLRGEKNILIGKGRYAIIYPEYEGDLVDFRESFFPKKK